ncbi:unnamed protein product [Cylindrotheca closterium]|uniref:Uncharacterized protein n=1 Tax=Cylindrotheca closterium TaxID=2856 RepID=A0AAD2JIL2_9STRA|nr:unnamed protein product [Cylindrotheca closterium]
MLIPQISSALYAGMVLISPDVPSFTQSSYRPQPTAMITAAPPPPTTPSTFLVPSPSSNAARLLVEPKSGSFARMANPQSSSSFQNNFALQQLFQQRALQDARLEQCQETQEEDFEQCFFYGTGGIDRMDGMGLIGGGVGRGRGLVGARYPSNAGIASNQDGTNSMMLPSSKKTTVPTW